MAGINVECTNLLLMASYMIVIVDCQVILSLIWFSCFSSFSYARYERLDRFRCFLSFFLVLNDVEHEWLHVDEQTFLFFFCRMINCVA